MDVARIQFDTLYRGEINIGNIKENSILTIGLTRVGKTCVFNYIQDMPMKGGKDGNSICYLPASKDLLMGKMANSIESVTLDPNIASLGSDLSLIDIAGFEQNRSAGDIIHVSYFLSILFDRLKKVKFILVFTESMMTNNRITEMTDTFNGFINLFNFKAMTPAMKNELLNSVSLVVSKAKQNQDFYINRFVTVAKELTQSKKLNKISNKELIVDVIARVTGSKRVEAFKQAEEGEAAPKSDIINKFNQAGWNYFDIPRNKADVKKNGNQDLVILPFQSDFNELEDHEQVAFRDFLKRRTESLTQGFAEMIRSYQGGLLQNWSLAMRSSREDGAKFQSIAIDNRSFLRSVDIFLAKNYDVYKSPELRQNLNFSKSTSVPLLSVIESTIKLKDIFEGQHAEEAAIEKSLNKLSQKIMLVITQMGAICQNPKELEKLTRVAFTIKRSIEEFLTFHKIQQTLLNDIHRHLQDLTIDALGNSIGYAKQVMNTIPVTIINQLFKTIPDLNNFQKLADDYMSYFKSNSTTSVEYNKDAFQYNFNYRMLKINSNVVKCAISEGDNAPPIQTFNHVRTLLEQLIVVINENKQNGKDHLSGNLQIKKIKYTKRAAELVMKLNPIHYSKKTSLAIQFSELSRCSQVTERLYKQAIEEELPGSKNHLDFLERYSKFLLKWRRIDEAIGILRKEHEFYLQAENATGLMIVASQLEEIQTSRANIQSAYLQMIKKLNNPFVDSENNQLKALCSEIKISLVVSSGVRVVNEPNRMAERAGEDDRDRQKKLKKPESEKQDMERMRMMELREREYSMKQKQELQLRRKMQQEAEMIRKRREQQERTKTEQKKQQPNKIGPNPEVRYNDPQKSKYELRKPNPYSVYRPEFVKLAYEQKPQMKPSDRTFKKTNNNE